MAMFNLRPLDRTIERFPIVIAVSLNKVNRRYGRPGFASIKQIGIRLALRAEAGY
jgi:hypothetical protein